MTWREAIVMFLGAAGLWVAVAGTPSSEQIAHSILQRYPLPHFTDAYIITPGIAGPGITKAQYPVAHRRIRDSGCVQTGAYFGSAKMNCVLERYGLSMRVSANTPAEKSIQVLNDYTIPY